MADRLRAVLAGCGGISKAWLNPLKQIPEVEVVGLVDLVEEKARGRAAEFGLAAATVGTSVEEVLDRTRPDVVFDCTLPEAHVSIALAALARGCHVLSEKPLADSMENGRRIVEAARKAGRVHAVMQNRRFLPRVDRLRRYLSAGGLGELTTLDSDFYLGAHFGGFRDRMRHVLLLDMAIHTFDMARFICGRDPEAVYCREWNPPGSWYDHDASAVAVFRMSGGLVYTYRGSWCAEGMNTSWEAEWRAIGTRGSVRWNGADDARGETVARAAGFKSELAPAAIPADEASELSGGHAGLLRDAVRCLLEGRAPMTVCTDNIRSLAMVFGAIESAGCGREVPIAV